MDLLSGIASWLGENEATISAVVGIAVLAGIVLAGLRSLARRRGETAQEKAPSASGEPAPATDSSPADLDPLNVPGFEGRPAIAVLAFDNLSGDPEQEYFADGIAEDLITRLSGWRRFPVLARNSSFVYRGKAVDVKQVGRELGAGYVVEGSVRQSASRVRVAAQLIDATTGHHVWAETYDRELRDIFELQDEISQAIVASIEPELLESELERTSHKDPQSLDAWDCVSRGWWHLNRFTKDDNQAALALFEQAAKTDPHYGGAFCGIAFVHYNDVLLQCSDSPARSVAEMMEAARRSVELDDKDPSSHLALGMAYSLEGQRDRMVSALEVAAQLNPSFSQAHSYLGSYLALAGRPDDAIPKLQKAMRLSPQDPWTWRHLQGMALAHLVAERYEEAIHWAEWSLQRKPDWYISYLILAGAYVFLSRPSEARAAVEEVLRLQPGLSVSGFKLFLSAADPAVFDRLMQGLRKAGLPE